MEDAINQWKEIEPDRIVFTGDLVHSKNQLTPDFQLPDSINNDSPIISGPII
jgi:hypothetical protein